MTSIIHDGDCRTILPSLNGESVQCVVTSPPYFSMRTYDHPDQIGLEATPAKYVAEIVAVFRALRRVLRHDGVAWLNLGDVYAQGGRGGVGANSRINGSSHILDESRRAMAARGEHFRKAPRGFKSKDLMLLPHRVAIALQADGWYVRSDVIWSKASPVPESVRDRPTRAHEYVFLLSRSRRYFYNADAISEPVVSLADNTPEDVARAFSRQRQVTPRQRQTALGRVGLMPLERRNARTVWSIPMSPYTGKHKAVMPVELARRCILAGSREGDVVLDPFCGAGTVGMVAARIGRSFVGIELNPESAEEARARIVADAPLLNVVGGGAIDVPA